VRRRLGALGAAVLLLAAVGGAPAVHAKSEGPSIPDIIVIAAEEQGADPQVMLAVAACESVFDPYAVGDQGNSLGLFQLHRFGLRSDFYEWATEQYGYYDVYDPYMQASYAAYKIAQGYGYHWTCYRKLMWG
jgi:hypothetical protein